MNVIPKLPDLPLDFRKYLYTLSPWKGFKSLAQLTQYIKAHTQTRPKYKIVRNITMLFKDWQNVRDNELESLQLDIDSQFYGVLPKDDEPDAAGIITNPPLKAINVIPSNIGPAIMPYPIKTNKEYYEGEELYDRPL